MFTATLIIWSDTGHTPVTGRGGSYCDELLNVQIQVKDHKDAAEIAQSKLHSTTYAARAHVAIPDYPNQNYRSQWIEPVNPDPRGT